MGYRPHPARIPSVPGPASGGAEAVLDEATLGLAQIDKERLSAEIKALDPDFSVLSVTFDGEGGSGKSAQTPAQSAAALIKGCETIVVVVRYEAAWCTLARLATERGVRICVVQLEDELAACVLSDGPWSSETRELGRARL